MFTYIFEFSKENICIGLKIKILQDFYRFYVIWSIYDNV